MIVSCNELAMKWVYQSEYECEGATDLRKSLAWSLPNSGGRLKGTIDILAGSVGSKNAHVTQWECITQFIQIVANLKAKLFQTMGFFITEIVLVTPDCYCVHHVAIRCARLSLADSCRAGWHGSQRWERSYISIIKVLLRYVRHCRLIKWMWKCCLAWVWRNVE